MTTKEKAVFDEWFREVNTWDLTGDDFLQLSFKSTNPGETVYTHPRTKSELTQCMACRWWDNYGKYMTAWKGCLEKISPAKLVSED